MKIRRELVSRDSACIYVERLVLSQGDRQRLTTGVSRLPGPVAEHVPMLGEWTAVLVTKRSPEVAHEPT